MFSSETNVLYRGFHCKYEYIVKPHNGHLCGYVCLPLSHPWVDKDYSEIGSSVHGGVTFLEQEQDGDWWVGFDCMSLVVQQCYVIEQCKTLCGEAAMEGLNVV